MPETPERPESSDDELALLAGGGFLLAVTGITLFVLFLMFMVIALQRAGRL